jgi:hypothetical protein
VPQSAWGVATKFSSLQFPFHRHHFFTCYCSSYLIAVSLRAAFHFTYTLRRTFSSALHGLSSRFFPLYTPGPLTASLESKYIMVISHHEQPLHISVVKSATIYYYSNMLSLILRGHPQGALLREHIYQTPKQKKNCFIVLLCWLL